MLHLARRCRATAVAVVLGAVLAPAIAAAQDFPVTIEHAFGTTTISERPERVAAVGWANHEVPLALGIVPVGFARAWWGDDDGDGIHPWVEERLEELGAGDVPLFDEGDGIDFEAVAATRPDVILAAYSGISETEYETLSRIAPVVAYRVGPWATDWREMIRLNAAGLGMAEEAEALIDRLKADIADAVAEHPEIEGKSAMFITHLDTRDLSVIRFYSANDVRVRFFEDLGLVTPDSVKEATEGGRFSGEISAERIDIFNDVDIVLTYGGQELLDQLRADPLTSRMAAVAGDGLVLLPNNPSGAAANPSPLGIPWVLDDYVARLAKAVAPAE